MGTILDRYFRCMAKQKLLSGKKEKPGKSAGDANNNHTDDDESHGAPKSAIWKMTVLVLG